MKYMGSKARFAKEILPIILKNRQPEQWYVEPFVGGGNMIDKVDGNRIGSDSNKYVIEALLSIRDSVNDLPKNNKEFTEEDYKQLKRSDTYIHKGYAGFAFSYGGKWLGGWCRDGLAKRDYVKEAYHNALSQSSKIKSVAFHHCEYDKLNIPDGSIIYCDPPYQGTTKYNDFFNHNNFWDWCRDMVVKNHTVFVSEYNAPNDFVCIWSKLTTSSLTKDTGSKSATEKLFVHESQLHLVEKKEEQNLILKLL